MLHASSLPDPEDNEEDDELDPVRSGELPEDEEEEEDE